LNSKLSELENNTVLEKNRINCI